MRRLAAFGFFLLFLGGIALVNLRGMGERRVAGQPPPSVTELASHPWHAMYVAGIEAAEPPGIGVQFDAGGGIVIRGSCNRFAGDYAYEDGNFLAGPLRGTDNDCADGAVQADAALLDVLEGPLLARRAGTELRFYTADGTLQLRLQPLSPP